MVHQNNIQSEYKAGALPSWWWDPRTCPSPCTWCTGCSSCTGGSWCRWWCRGWEPTLLPRTAGAVGGQMSQRLWWVGGLLLAGLRLLLLQQLLLLLLLLLLPSDSTPSHQPTLGRQHPKAMCKPGPPLLAAPGPNPPLPHPTFCTSPPHIRPCTKLPTKLPLPKTLSLPNDLTTRSSHPLGAPVDHIASLAGRAAAAPALARGAHRVALQARLCAALAAHSIHHPVRVPAADAGALCVAQRTFCVGVAPPAPRVAAAGAGHTAAGGHALHGWWAGWVDMRRADGWVVGWVIGWVTSGNWGGCLKAVVEPVRNSVHCNLHSCTAEIL